VILEENNGILRLHFLITKKEIWNAPLAFRDLGFENTEKMDAL